MKNFKNYVLPVSLILILSFSRIIPHPSNFTPLLAVGIFSGFYFKKFFLSVFIVLLSMFLGDLYLGFHDTMIFTYLALIAAVGIGLLIKQLKTFEIFLSGVCGSICFFLITNFGAWITLEMYEKNMEGLVSSYIMAIPFFHNTLISTCLYLIGIKIIYDWIVKSKKLKVECT